MLSLFLLHERPGDRLIPVSHANFFPPKLRTSILPSSRSESTQLHTFQDNIHITLQGLNLAPPCDSASLTQRDKMAPYFHCQNPCSDWSLPNV